MSSKLIFIMQLNNTKRKQQKTITICCEDSFTKILEQQDDIINEASLVLLDEYQEYPSTEEQVCKTLKPHGPLIIASSATPPKEDIIQDTLYSFTLKDALNGHYHAPIVAGFLNGNYSKGNVKLFIQCLPSILTNQYHPGFG